MLLRLLRPSEYQCREGYIKFTLLTLEAQRKSFNETFDGSIIIIWTGRNFGIHWVSLTVINYRIPVRLSNVPKLGLIQAFQLIQEAYQQTKLARSYTDKYAPDFHDYMARSNHGKPPKKMSQDFIINRHLSMRIRKQVSQLKAMSRCFSRWLSQYVSRNLKQHVDMGSSLGLLCEKCAH